MTTTLKDQYSLSPIGLGAMPLSLAGRPSEQDSISIIKTFVEHGGNFIDTADVYGLDDADKGHNEKLICKALKEIGRIDHVIVATKGGATRPDGGWGMGGGHPKKLRQACEQSLVNLQTSELSLYYLHGPDPDIPFEDSIGELVNLKEEGKIRNIGIANVTLEELKLATNLTTITAVQNRCNPFCKGDFKNGVIDFCKSNKIIYVPYCPLGGWMDHVKLASSDLYAHLTEKYQATSYSISLAWLLMKGDGIVPIPGMDRKDHLTANFKVRGFKLLSEDILKIDAFPDLYFPKHQ